MYFSIIIPVFNRPNEIEELLQSLDKSNYTEDFEILIIEDGSTEKCEDVIEKYKSKLNIQYFFKTNSGPGDSRNFGMTKARGDYFLIFDSDCIIPEQYLNQVSEALKFDFVDCFGGPDTALKSFSMVQKAINFSMTSFLTTGGIRGGTEKMSKFQPRSFNLGISKVAFDRSGGFGNIHPGEDPDLAIRLWELGFKTKLIKSAFVYHKRRINFQKFFTQINKFGKTRLILNVWYPKYKKVTYLFPTYFILGLLISIILTMIGSFYFLWFYLFYFLLIFVSSSIKNKNIAIGFVSILTTLIQFYGYGIGFLNSYYRIKILKLTPQQAFPELFFRS
jgi:glycosyltransferase involved in cell wall biosynthesis